MNYETIGQQLSQKMTDNLFLNLKSVQRKCVSDTLKDELIELIMDEVLKPGYVFPNENEMCKNLNISRSTIREVYSALEAMGFITRSKAGTSINSMDKIRSAIPLSYLFRKADIDEVMEYRIMLECQIAYMAAKVIDDSVIKQLEDILSEMIRNNGSDIIKMTQLDIKFHYTLAMGCNNRLLVNTLAAVTNEIHRSAYSGYDIEPEVTIKNSINYHTKILNAIKDHNQKAAREAMREHIKDVYTELRKQLV